MPNGYALTEVVADMKKGPSIAVLLALAISAASLAQQTGTPAQEPPLTKITSPDEVKKITSRIADLIAPFTLQDIRTGFKDESALWSEKPQAGMLTNFSGRYVDGQQVGYSFANLDSGLVETRTMTKARPGGGKISVEIGLERGSITGMDFKVLPDKAGFQDIWNAQPTVSLSKRASSNAGDGIGFEIVQIRQGDTTTRYELSP